MHRGRGEPAGVRRIQPTPRRTYYSLESSYLYLKEEDTYATVRGPGYVPSYDRYSHNGSSSPPAKLPSR